MGKPSAFTVTIAAGCTGLFIAAPVADVHGHDLGSGHDSVAQALLATGSVASNVDHIPTMSDAPLPSVRLRQPLAEYGEMLRVPITLGTSTDVG